METERLTIKYNDTSIQTYVLKDDKNNQKAREKLGQLEDIEEELGIDLITYFKIKVGVKVYTKFLTGDDLIIDFISGNGRDTLYHIVPKFSRSGVYVKPNEYGIYWALTREELEK